VRSTSSITRPTVEEVFLYGITNGGDRSGTVIDKNTFLDLLEPEGGYERLRFRVNLPHPLRNELSLSQATAMTQEWRLDIYRYRPDKIYSNQTAIELNHFQVETDNDFYSLVAEVDRKELSQKLGDCRAFASQVLDAHGNSLWQGYFSLNSNLILGEIDVRKAIQDGLVIGSPYSTNEKQTAFRHSGKFIEVREPQGGFYRLSYIFDLALATGDYIVSNLETAAGGLTIRLFPYREDGNYPTGTSQALAGKLISTAGILIVDLPIDYLRATSNGKAMYFLQVADGNGNTIKGEYLTFISQGP
jgi:hypothetical protein